MSTPRYLVDIFLLDGHKLSFVTDKGISDYLVERWVSYNNSFFGKYGHILIDYKKSEGGYRCLNLSLISLIEIIPIEKKND